jgi:hypothetical protein
MALETVQTIAVIVAPQDVVELGPPEVLDAVELVALASPCQATL